MLSSSRFLVLFAFLSLSMHIYGLEFKLFNFKKQAPESCKKEDPDCITTQELIQMALKQSYESREKIEALFQVRRKTKEILGNMLPRLNIGSAMTVATLSMPDTIYMFVGFLFPNRWLHWKENRVLEEAEIESYRSLLANRVNVVQDIYFVIQKHFWGMSLYKHYMDQISVTVDELKTQNDRGLRRISIEDLNVLENIKARLRYHRAGLDNLMTTKALMAQAVGLDFDRSWMRLKFMTTRLHPLTDARTWYDNPEAMTQVYPECLKTDNPNPEAEDLVGNCINVALERSTEIKSIDHLIDAAKNGKRSNYFEFIDPRSNNDLGYGFGQRIKIHKSKMEVLRVQRDRWEAQIRVDMIKAYNELKAGLERNLAAESGLRNLEALRVACEEMIRNPNTVFDINMVFRFFEFSVDSAVTYLFSFFEVRSAQAIFNRYTWNGPLYEFVEDYADNLLEIDYEKVEQKHKLRFFRRLIEKAMGHKKKLDPSAL